MTNQRQSIFAKYAKNLSSLDYKSTSHFLLKEHGQLSAWIDILYRHNRHHLILIKSSTNIFNEAIIETLNQELITTPGILQKAERIYFDVTNFMLSSESIDDIENDFRILCDNIRINNKNIIFFINQLHPFLNPHQSIIVETLGKYLKSFLLNDQWRVIVLSDYDFYQKACENHLFLKEIFTPVRIKEPTEAEILTLLKHHRLHLEKQQIIISEEVLYSSLSLADTYFSGHSTLDKAVELLDIAATRMQTLPIDLAQQKYIMTNSHLIQVVYHWTGIPLIYLQNNKFQSEQLIDALQQTIYGQDQAIRTISSLLQNACIKLNKKPGPLCSFLLVGPVSVGKASLVNILAEQLYGQQNAVLRINFNNAIQCLEEVTVNIGLYNANSMDLLSAIQQIPYGILFFENVDELSITLRNIIKNILTHGILYDGKGNRYDFRHAIVIFSTTVKADRIMRFMQNIPESSKQMDLMQLILNEHIQEAPSYFNQQHLQDQMIEYILSDLTAHFSEELLQELNIIPFLPLNIFAMEKIMQNKMHVLKKRLEMLYSIEIQYANEIIKFLAHEALWGKRAYIKSIDKIVEFYLYSPVSQAILQRMDTKNIIPKRLVLQLNENGQALRCEFINLNSAVEIT